MPNATDDKTRFRICYHINTDLHDRGCDPYTYFAAIGLQLSIGSGRILVGKNLPFRLDTESFISAIPEGWINNPRLQHFLKTLSSPLSFGTTTGRGAARVARGMFVRFPHDRRELALDFLVMEGLNARQYGLISLRDVVNHFSMETVGPVRYRPTGEPAALPDFVLHARQR
jgi:hypothetical protein